MVLPAPTDRSPIAPSRLAIRAALALVVLVACSGPVGPGKAPAHRSAVSSVHARAARTALAMVGAPYRYGGATPEGFDCSGLVSYSFGRAGAVGLPRTAADLERRARSIPLGALRPGDLLFFRLGRRRTTHVGVYVGNAAFVHAPSSGKRVEKVGFDHPYWGARLRRAGRLELGAR